MKVITVATEKSGYYYSLEESANKLGYDLILLGYKLKWKGFGWRLSIILDYLRTLPKNEIVMIVDAYDVVLLRSSDDALNIFKEMNVKFLCGSFRKLDGIMGFFQENEFGSSKPEIPPPYNNLCAGTWMSKVETILDIYSKYDFKYNDDDQVLLNRIFDEDKNGVIVPDYNFNIFCTVFPNIINRYIRDIDKIYIIDNKLKCDVTNTEPVLIHGLANTRLDLILQQLGFANYQDQTTFNYTFKKLWYHVKLICKIFFKKYISG